MNEFGFIYTSVGEQKFKPEMDGAAKTSHRHRPAPSRPEYVFTDHLPINFSVDFYNSFFSEDDSFTELTCHPFLYTLYSR